MSSITAGTTTTNAIVTTGDTTGALVLKTNNTNTALTLNTSGAVGVGSSPAYGSSGQALISQGSSAAPVWGTVGVSGGGTGLTSVGSNGQVLQSNGTGLQYATPTTPGMVLISTKTASSSASLEWTGLSGYSRYVLYFNNLLPASSSLWNMLVGTGATPTYLTSGYNIVGLSSYNNNGTATTEIITSSSAIVLASLTGTFVLLAGSISFENVLSSTTYANTVSGNYCWNRAGNMSQVQIGGRILNEVGAITAIKIQPSTGNITSGSAALYGLTS